MTLFRYFTIVLIVCLFWLPVNSSADEIKVAVASNFIQPLRAIVEAFEQDTGHRVVVIPGATGKLYAQIIHGAPFDVFLSADSARPEKLELSDKGIKHSRFTYALGKLVLWSSESGRVDAQGSVLHSKSFRYLSIANPKLAPYGKAAQEVLSYKGLWDKLQLKMVRGENIAQAYQYVKTGNAELGFVSLSQILDRKARFGDSAADTKAASQKMIDDSGYWLVPSHLYSPIEQQAVLLNNTSAAREFLTFLRSPAIVKMIHDYGYSTP